MSHRTTRQTATYVKARVYLNVLG